MFVIQPTFAVMRLRQPLEDSLAIFKASLYFQNYLEFSGELPTTLSLGSRIILAWNNPSHPRLTIRLTIGLAALDPCFAIKNKPDPAYCLVVGVGFSGRILKMQPEFTHKNGLDISMLGYYARLARCVTDQFWECPDHLHERKNIHLRYLVRFDTIAWRCSICGSWKPLSSSLSKRIYRYADPFFLGSMTTF